MSLYKNELYMEDINYVGGLGLPWDKLQDRSILISGATGLVGSFLVDVLMQKNKGGLNCTVYAMSRNAQKATDRFSKWNSNPLLQFISHDVTQPFKRDDLDIVDYILHMASNTHPLQYSTDPIGTITTNILGVQNMLEFAASHNVTRFAFTSSNEIYGEDRGDVELFDENYCGYINCNTIRAGYPESKRCGEALCQAYKAQKGLDVVIPRLTRSYGPTVLMSDTKAINQFIKNGIVGEDIVLKSAGTQYYSYTYVADAVSGLLYVLLKGENGGAYNISDIRSDITLKNLAATIADITGKKVVFEKPDAVEATGYSKVNRARLDSTKLKALGWTAKYDIKSGMERTIYVLKSIR